MVAESQLKNAEQVLKEKYNEYLADKKKLNDDRKEYHADKKELEDRKHKSDTKKKDLQAEEERLNNLNNTLEEEKKANKHQWDSLVKEKEEFAKEKETEEEQLSGLQERIYEYEKEITNALINTGFYQENLEESFAKLREDIDEISLREEERKLNNLNNAFQEEKKEFDLEKKEKEDKFAKVYLYEDKVLAHLKNAGFDVENILDGLKKFKEEIDEFNQKEKTKRAIAIRSKKEKPAQSKHKIPTHNFKDEKALVEHIKKYIASHGFYYEDGVIENFYTSLKAGYLVILSGISGVGKSKLPQLFAESIDAGYKMIPVRPDWNDDRDLLGFFNISTKQYQTTRFIEFLIKANKNRDRLYIACLDEMNLAPVEYYFAQLLSQMENEEPRLNPPDEMFTKELLKQVEGEITLEKMRLLKDLEVEKDDDFRDIVEERISQLEENYKRLLQYEDIRIPDNVKFVGTVNMDHTTHGFSDKVLDRANVIQFEYVDIGKKMPPKNKGVKEKGLNFTQFEKFCAPDKRAQNTVNKKLSVYKKELTTINKILSEANINIGFRVAKAIEKYLYLALQGKYNKDERKVFDSQIKQRVLPKIQGMKSDELTSALDELKNFFENNRFVSSLEKIAGKEQDGTRNGGMIRQLERKGYVNYWELK